MVSESKRDCTGGFRYRRKYLPSVIRSIRGIVSLSQNTITSYDCLNFKLYYDPTEPHSPQIFYIFMVLLWLFQCTSSNETCLSCNKIGYLWRWKCRPCGGLQQAIENVKQCYRRQTTLYRILRWHEMLNIFHET